jgi:hypothetical protein
MNRFLFSLLLTTSLNTYAAPYSGNDYSGVYYCTGQDHSEGEYKGTVTMHLAPRFSDGEYGAYEFLLEIPGFGAYPGHAASQGNKMAIYFANKDPKDHDFGTGIATFSKNKTGKWSFVKFYYEPQYKSGNFGKEICTQH